MAKYLTIKPKLLAKVAVLLHRQNPQVLSIESASQTVEGFVKEVQKKGRKSGNHSYEIGSAGFTVVWSEDADGFEEVRVLLNVIDLWYGEDNETTDGYVWGAIDRLKTVPSKA